MKKIILLLLLASLVIVAFASQGWCAPATAIPAAAVTA